MHLTLYFACRHWNLQLDLTDAAISGGITVHTHYFESGNLQLRSHKDVAAGSLNSSTQDSEALAQEAVAWIRQVEEGQHNALNDMYAGMSDTLKALRRSQTVTKEKFSWKIAQIRTRNTMMSIKK